MLSVPQGCAGMVESVDWLVALVSLTMQELGPVPVQDWTAEQLADKMLQRCGQLSHECVEYCSGMCKLA